MAATNDDISLRHVVTKIKFWIQYLRSKFILIAILGLFGAGIGFMYAYTYKPEYTGTLTFVLSTDSKGSGGGLSGLASQFGLDMGGGSNDLFSGENIITLMNSQSILKKTLFKTIPGSNDLLVNMIVREIGMDQGWQSAERTINAFPFRHYDSITPIQDSLLNEIHGSLVSKFINITKPDKKQSFYKADVTSTNQVISVYLVKYLVDETAKFYIETKTKLARQNLEMLQHEADSIHNILSATISRNVNTIDKTYNLNPALQVQRSSTQIGQLNITALGGAYSEIVKNLELAKLNLLRETPLFQIVDSPELPLRIIKKSKRTMMTYGFLIAAIAVSIFLLLSIEIRKAIRPI